MLESRLDEVPVAILAGGLATRLRPITERIPKVLVPVAGRPFLSHQLDLLKRQGIRRVVLCLGYLGESVVEQYGDGQAWGLDLQYCFDGPVLLGTGGAIKKALPLLGERFFVMYGDSYLPIPMDPIARHFELSGSLGLMTVFRNSDQFDASNIWFEGGQILRYEKQNRTLEMKHIDYGLSMFRPAAFAGFAPDEPLDLSSVIQRLLGSAQLCAYEVFERFYEIGSHSGLAELEALLAN